MGEICGTDEISYMCEVGEVCQKNELGPRQSNMVRFETWVRYWAMLDGDGLDAESERWWYGWDGRKGELVKWEDGETNAMVT
jgi:hypothetical protein